MNNVAGLSKAMAKKSTDLDMKCEYINELNSSYSRNSQARGVTFSTGTPVSNSMVELYTVQTYLQRDELKKLGLQHFDNWAANFGEVVSALELAPSGQNYRVKERFAKFVNLPELMNLYRKVADIQTAEMLNLPVPKLKSGKPITIAVEPSPFLIQYVKELLKRSEDIHNGLVKSHIDNMLCVTSDGRNAALDVRCVDPNAEDFEDSKVNTCIRNVFDIYKRTEEDKSAQMIFCDLSTPKGGKSFSVYDDIKKKLIDMGVKPNEISFIHEADTDLKKEKMFSDVRSGTIRIILGSTAKMGAGTNCQTRLKALHNLDCPYRPSDLSQRAGRIVRQGNKNEEVEIYNYVTKQSFDSYLWQIVESKQKFISQIMSGKSPSRSMDDIDETVLNFAEVKAIATGNPKIKLKMELDTELSRLQVLEAQHRANRYSLEDKIIKKYPVQISLLTEKISGLESDILLRTKNEPIKSVESIKTIEPVDGLENSETTEQTPFKMNLGNKDFTERKDAGDLLLKALDSGKYADKEIGTFKGFTIIALPKNNFLESNSVMLKGESTYKVELSSSGVGCISRIENTLKNLETTLSDKQRELQTTQNQVETAKLQVMKPFEHEETLKNVLSQLTEINSELDMDKDLVDKPVLVDEDEDILGLDEEDLNENEYDSEEDEIEI